MRVAVGIGVVVVAAAAVAFVAFATAVHGLGVSVDAVKYLSTGRSLLAGEGFVQFDGEPYVLWPPLYPLVIAAAGLADTEIVEALRFVHLAVFALVLLASAVFLRRLDVPGAVVVVGVAAVAVAPPVLQIVVAVQSELIFVAFVLAYLFAITRAIERPTRTRIAIAGIVVALATLQRYAGVALAASGALTLVIAPRSTKLGRRFVEAAGFVFVAMLPLAGWLARNAIVAGGMFGDHPAGTRSLALNARDLVDTLSSWFLPARSMGYDERMPYGIAILAVATLGLVVSSIVRARRASHAPAPDVDEPETPPSIEPDDDARTGAPAPANRSRLVWIVAAFVLVAIYIGFYLTTSTLRHQGRIGHRYMGPIWIPTFGLLLAGFCSAAAGFARLARSRYAASILPIAALVAWGIAVAAPRLEDTTDQLRRGGFSGYTAVGWQRSPMLEWLAEHRDEVEGSVYTNSTEALYYVLGLESQALRTRLSHPAKIRDSAVVDHDAWIVWFDPYLSRRPLPKGTFADFDRLREGATVEPWRRFVDGTIYRVRF